MVLFKMELWGFHFPGKVVVKGEFLDAKRFLIIFLIGAFKGYGLMWSFVFVKTWKHGKFKEY